MMPNPARIYNYLIGGTTNSAEDREAAKRLIAAKPDLLRNVRENRAYLTRVVRYLAGTERIGQFLDVGAGIPAMDNTHEVAQRSNPSARIVYADNDPEVLTHAQSLLTSTAEGAVRFIQADLRDPADILARAADSLDFSAPVAILMLGVLYVIPDRDDPCGNVGRLLRAAASGSYLAISHPASDIHAEEATRGASVFAQNTELTQTNRTRAEVTRFLDGLDMVEPGVVQLNKWRPAPDADTSATVSSWAAVGRKS